LKRKYAKVFYQFVEVEAKVTERKIEEIAKLKADLDKKELDIPTLVKLAKEV